MPAKADSAVVDCLVIGGGPAGLTAAIYLARFRRAVLIVHDAASRAELIPKTHNYPGFCDGISGRDLLAALREQAQRYGAALRQATVTGLAKSDDGLRAAIGDEAVSARTVILACGIVDEKPSLPGLSELIESGRIRFCPVCDAYEAGGKRIAVIGPARHAFAKALFLRTYTSTVTLLTFEGSAALDPDQRRAVEEAGIVAPSDPIAQLTAEDNSFTAVTAGGTRLELDVVYAVMGARARSELAIGLGAQCNEDGLLIVDAKQRTSVEHLYAVGDLTVDLHQLSVATGQAAVAACDVHNSLPDNYV